MSLVSSVLSSRRHRAPSSPGWRINIRLSALMDSLAAIAFGLGLRFCIDTVGRYDFKLTGTLVGLWEGVILLHFLKKTPRSADPYIGFGVRLFVDFLFTESVARLVLVLIWTALGMVLADITPALWDEVGLRRMWRRLRRDLYTLTRMIPTVAFFPPPRTVRFSPSRQPSLVTEEAPTEAPTHDPDMSVLEPSIITTATEQTQTPLTSLQPPSTTTPAPAPAAAREILKRRVPGHFPSGYSDTDTEIGSPRRRTRSAGRTRDRRSMYPGELDTSSELSSPASADVNEEDDLDLDDANRSSLSGSGSDVTERGVEGEGEQSTTLHLNMDEVPDMPTEDPLLVDTSTNPPAHEHEHDAEEGDLTPKQHPVPFPPPYYMPPTPSDSAARMHRNRRILEDREVQDKDKDKDKESIPPPEQLPQIPDFLEDASTEDWEKIQREDAEERPPTPPEKERPVSGSGATNANTTLPVPPPRQTRTQTQAQVPAPDEDNEGWDTLDSQFLNPNSNSNNNTINNTITDANTNNNTTNDHTQPPPSYQSQSYNADTNYDDIYDDPAPADDTFNLFGGGEPASNSNSNSNNPWKAAADVQAEAEAKAVAARVKLQQEQKEKEEAERQRAAEEKFRQEAAAAAAAVAEAEAEAQRKKKEEEKAERLRKEAADNAARLKKREEEAAKQHERERELQLAASAALQAEAEKTAREQAEEASRLARLESERAEQWWRKDAETQRIKEETEKEKQEREMARVRRVSLDARERKAALEADKKRGGEEEKQKIEAEKAENARKESEEKAKKQAEAAEKRLKEEEDARKIEEERKAQEAEEAERLRLQQEEDERKQKEEEGRVQQEEEERQQIEEDEQHREQETEQQQELEEEPTQVAATPRQAGPDTLPAEDAAEGPSSEDVPQTYPPTEPVASPPTEDPEQNPNHDDAALQDSYEEESVVTQASEVPDKVGERLGNIILLKAQMAEIEEQISQLKQGLKAASEEDKTLLDGELKAKEKILRKMRRKEQRRRDGMPAPRYADGKNDSATDKLNPREAELKIEEKLEQLLAPGVKSINYLIKVQGGQAGKKQMPNVTNTLLRYRLFEYTNADKSNGRWMTVDVSEDQFNTWLKAYRTSVTQANDEDSDSY